MVMECPPSPDSVGREFVRQYYTLLNKAPIHLHRFYNNQSSFVHGGLDPPLRETLPMVGQKQIHQKIQQLNFQDCHAKIIQVDAQATLGNGVVVQVTGELSNAGQPMRRFTQTFVLAAQSPKKYYVHNDIFRYQDEIISISDEECENEGRPADEGEMNPDRHELQPLNPATLASYYNPNNAPLPQVVPHQHHMMQAPPPQPPLAVPTVNGAVHQDELLPATMQPALISNPSTTSLPVATSQAQVQTVPVVGILEETMIVPLGVEEGAGDATEYIDSPPIAPIKAEIVEEICNEPISNEPKTYATLLKSGGGFAGLANNNNVFASAVPPPVSPPPPIAKVEQRDNQQFQMNNQRNHRGGDNRFNRPVVPLRPRPDMRNLSARPSDDGGNTFSSFDEHSRFKPFKTPEERRRSQSTFADGNQLFLGNLPLSATEDDLREVFEKFGPIVDLRIHSKPSKPGPGTRAPPNYGFITYETPEGVQACLAAKPIQLPGNDKTGPTVLNVEEKKIKERPFGGNMRNNPGDTMSPRPPRDTNGPRRGAMSGGPPRGGGPMGAGGSGGGGPRPNSFNRSGQANRGANNAAYSRR